MIPMGVAAGWVKQPKDLDKLLRVPSDILSSITLGSYTLAPRDGNPGNVFTTDASSGTSLNALGLPNPGMSEISIHLLDMVCTIQASGKKARISIAGFSPSEYESLFDKILHTCSTCDAVEFNLGCPNVRVEGVQKPFFSFSQDALYHILRGATKQLEWWQGPKPALAVKLSPYSNPAELSQVAELLVQLSKQYERVQIVTCNTFANGISFDQVGKPFIDPNDGYGGVSGTALKEIALGQVRQFAKAAPELRIVGVGGISHGDDLRAMEHAGASEVQIGTAYFRNEDPHIFQDIAHEYVNSFVGNT